VVNPFPDKKKKRLRHFYNVLKGQGRMLYKKAIALNEYNYGTSTKVAKNDIEVLIYLGAVRRDGAFIETVDVASLSPSADKKDKKNS
jgi:hypothetical protein